MIMFLTEQKESLDIAANNRIQLTVKSVMFFAMQKNMPLFTVS